ncbi:phosphate uptake regulator PhoU [Candidatus Woesearchaeota archaeon]|nr:phosphate uptake regulator PhoU [Candidatus Woesearchaeota archaeon]
MLRKIIRLGKETYVVSLPSAWMKQHRLKKGDELEVEETGPKLLISPKSEAKQGKAVADVSGIRPIIKRLLGALYKSGYDEFEVRFESREELSSIKEVMGEFVGFELIEEGKSHAIIKNVSHIIPDEFDSMQRKMMFVISTMAEECLDAAAAKDWKKLQLLAGMDADVNRYADFCRRILNTVGHRVVKRVPPSYYIVEQLERIGDSYREICAYCGNSRIGIGTDVAAAFGKVNSFFRQFQKAYARFDVKGIAEFARTHYELVKDSENLLQQADRKELPVLVWLKIAELDIFDMNGALMAEKL